MISIEAHRNPRKKRPWERKIPIKPGPPEEMPIDDALERFIDEWIVFKITKPDDVNMDDVGVVVAHGGPEKPMREIARRIWTAEPEGRLLVEYCWGRRIRSGDELRRAIDAHLEYLDSLDADEWADVWR